MVGRIFTLFMRFRMWRTLNPWLTGAFYLGRMLLSQRRQRLR
jgi:hypothetical protein